MISEFQKIGVAISSFGIMFLFLGVFLLFDRGLLAMGNLMFIIGFTLVVGLESTYRFFLQREKFKGSTAFFGGIIIVLLGFPIIGMCVEAYGFFLIFSGYVGIAVSFLRRMPIVGDILCLPYINSVATKLEGTDK